MSKLITQTLVKDRLTDDLFGESMLKEWVANTRKFADIIIIHDTGSTDGTYEWLKEHEDEQLIVKKSYWEDYYSNQVYMRIGIWTHVRSIALEGDLIMTLDSDEFPDAKAMQEKRQTMFENADSIFRIQICDMWNEEEYRVDGGWSPHQHVIFPYQNKPYTKETNRGLHQGKCPWWIDPLPRIQTGIKFRHYSYHTQLVRDKKYEWYMPKVTGVNLEHAKTIKTEPMLKRIE